MGLDELSHIQIDSSRVVISLDETTNKMGSEDSDSTMHEWLMDEQQENPSDVYEEKDTQDQSDPGYQRCCRNVNRWSYHFTILKS